MRDLRARIAGRPAKTFAEAATSRARVRYSAHGAGMAEPVDARDLGSRGETRGGSSPPSRTTRHSNVRAIASLKFEVIVGFESRYQHW